MTEQFPEEDETAEGLNLAPGFLGLEAFVRWIYETFAELANLEEPLPDDGVLVGPDDKTGDRDKSIWATPNEFRFREGFASVNHRKEWRSVLAALAYLVESGKVRCPGAPRTHARRQPDRRSATAGAD